MKAVQTKININPFKVFVGLTVIALALSLIYLFLLFFNTDFNASTQSGVTALFNLNAEVSIPTWYSQSNLLISAGALLVIGLASKSYRRYWFGLAGIFTYVSVDEGAAIHELTVSPIKRLFGIESGLFYFSWVILFGFIFILLCLVYLKYYLALPQRTKFLFFLAAAIFLAGAVGLEMIGGAIAAESGEFGTTYGIVVAGEEFMEMLGVTVFIYSLLDFMKIKKISFIVS